MKDNKNLIEQLGHMSVMDFVELTRQLEETWGVSASDAHTRVIQPDPNMLTVLEPPPEYDLVMISPGSSKVRAVRLIREVTGLGLSECMVLASDLPSVIRSGLEPEVARDLEARFEELGADVELR